MNKQIQREIETKPVAARLVADEAARTCAKILSGLQEMAQDGANRDALAHINRLGNYTRKVETVLAEAEDVSQNPLAVSAEEHWAKALVLMDEARVEQDEKLQLRLVKLAAELQKSGITG